MNIWNDLAILMIPIAGIVGVLFNLSNYVSQKDKRALLDRIRELRSFVEGENFE